MALVTACGFECGAIGDALSAGSHVTALITAAAFDTSIVRSGARSMRVNPAAGQTAYAQIDIPSTPLSTFVGRFYLRFTTLPLVNTGILVAEITGAPGLYFNAADSKLYAAGSVVLMGATGASVTTGVWYLIDIKMIVSANPWTIDVQVDTVALGQATSALAATIVGRVRAGSNVAGACDVRFEDFTASRTSGDYPIGAGFVNHFVPTADGAHNVSGANDFERGTTGVDIINSTTTAFQLVDDVPLDEGTPTVDDYINCIAPPLATDYVEVVFGPAPGISVPTTGPRITDVIYAHHETGTGTGVQAAKYNDNGTIADIYNPGLVAGVTTIRFIKRADVVAPSTGAAWTAALFNNLRLRFGFSSDANPDQHFDCAMIEAEFAPVAAGARRRQHVIEEE